MEGERYPGDSIDTFRKETQCLIKTIIKKLNEGTPLGPIGTMENHKLYQINNYSLCSLHSNASLLNF